MATFNYAIDWSPQASERPRVLSSKFGDGYEQRVADGINVRPLTYDLQFKNRSATEAGNILTFLRARNGVESFDWTPPNGSAGKYVCREWNHSPDQVDRYTVTAKFEQVFE